MAVIGTGTSITFSTGFFAEIQSVKWTGIERESIETTHMGTTTARSFLPGTVYDPGQLEVEINFVPATPPPIGGAAETVTVTFPDASDWAATGYMSAFEFESATEDKITGNATLKFTDGITF